MLTIKWQTRVRKTLPTNYWQKWMRTRYLPNLYFAPVEVKRQSQENWFLCFTLTIFFKLSAARWTCVAAYISISCLWKIILLNNRLKSTSVFVHLLQIADICNSLSLSYAFIKEKVKYINGIQMNSINLVVIFSPLPFLFFASLSQHCGVLDSGALFVNLNGSIWCPDSLLVIKNRCSQNNGQAESGR